jgi:hypothetical protein
VSPASSASSERLTDERLMRAVSCRTNNRAILGGRAPHTDRTSRGVLGASIGVAEMAARRGSRVRRRSELGEGTGPLGRPQQ